jgi:hypothetical protein
MDAVDMTTDDLDALDLAGTQITGFRLAGLGISSSVPLARIRYGCVPAGSRQKLASN